VFTIPIVRYCVIAVIAFGCRGVMDDLVDYADDDGDFLGRTPFNCATLPVELE
jgi:hypothetical protein